REPEGEEPVLRRPAGAEVEPAAQPEGVRLGRALPARPLLLGMSWRQAERRDDDQGDLRALARGRRPPQGPELDPGILRALPRRPELHARVQPDAAHRP